jgi:hypothetical protein
LWLSVFLARVTSKHLAKIVGQSLVITYRTLEEYRAFLETLKETATLMIIVRESHTIGTLQIDWRIFAVLLKNLNIAYPMALAVQGESQT